MKTGIHPDYHQVTVSCACGNTFVVGSTNKEDIRVEICAHCHPLYTGKAKLVDTAGRVDKFQARQAAAQKHKATVNAKKGVTLEEVIPVKEEKAEVVKEEVEEVKENPEVVAEEIVEETPIAEESTEEVVEETPTEDEVAPTQEATPETETKEEAAE